MKSGTRLEQAPFLPASPGLRKRHCPPPLGVQTDGAPWPLETTSKDQHRPGLSPPSCRATTRQDCHLHQQANSRQAGLWARQRAILAEAPHERLFPKRSPSKVLGQARNVSLRRALRAATRRNGIARFPTGPSFGTKCNVAPAPPESHSHNSYPAKRKGGTISTTPRPTGSQPVYTRSDGVQPKPLGNTPQMRGSQPQDSRVATANVSGKPKGHGPNTRRFIGFCFFFNPV